jgi:hypothetical protein
MVDYTFGVVKQSAADNASNDQALVIGLDFWTLNTSVNILTSTQVGGSATSQAALNKLVEIISLNGQPVILNNPTGSAGTYSLLFAIEHPGSWTAGTYSTLPTTTTLVGSIQVNGVNYGFGTDNLLSATVLTNVIP